MAIKNGPSGDGPLSVESVLLYRLSAHTWLAPAEKAVVVMRVEVRRGGEHETHPKHC